MSKTFQAPATLTRLSFTSDGGLNLGFVTQELTAEEKLVAARSHRVFGWVMFKESEAAFADSEIPQDDPTDEPKKPSERLRAVLFLLWKKTAAHTDVEFNDYYRLEMAKIIGQQKRLLDEEY